jgi:hypothetical protein
MPEIIRHTFINEFNIFHSSGVFSKLLLSVEEGLKS